MSVPGERPVPVNRTRPQGFARANNQFRKFISTKWRHRAPGFCGRNASPAAPVPMRAIVFEGSASMLRRGALAIVELSRFDVSCRRFRSSAVGEPSRDFCSRSDHDAPIGERDRNRLPHGQIRHAANAVVFVGTPARLTGSTSPLRRAQPNCQADRQEICIKEGAAENVGRHRVSSCLQGEPARDGRRFRRPLDVLSA